MAVVHRNGLSIDFEKSKMAKCEIDIVRDTQEVFVSFDAGKVKQIATKEDFKADIDEIQELKDTTIMAAEKAESLVVNKAGINDLTPTLTEAYSGAKTEQIVADARAYADGLFGSIVEFNIEVVEELPTENIQTHTIYLVAKEPKPSEAYDEYLYINSAWEHIGTTDIDLSGYYTKEEVEESFIPKNQLVVNVKDYGAMGNGVTDDTVAIQNAISYCASIGGGIVYFPPTTVAYIISATISLGNGTTTKLSTINGIRCRGGSTGSTRIKWNGGTGGTMFKIAGISFGNSLGDLTLDGNNLADIGCDVVSGQYAQWGDLRIVDCAKTLRLTTLSSVISGETGNTIGNVFGKLTLKPSTGTSTSQSYALILDGEDITTGDTNNNYFPNIHVYAQTNYITSIRLGFADFNKFDIVVCFNAPDLVGCYGLHIDGTVVSGFPNANQFDSVSFAQAPYQTGTPGVNYVRFYGTVDGALSIPSISGLYGLAQNPYSVHEPPIPFGQGAPLNVQAVVKDRLLTTTNDIDIFNINLAQDGLYQVNLYLKVLSTTTLRGLIYFDDGSGAEYAFLRVAPTKHTTVNDIVLYDASLQASSYVSYPITFRYKGGGIQKPVLRLTAGTANQIYVSASIVKVG